MRAFIEVLKYELKGLIGRKSYRISLIVMLGIIVLGLSAPSLFNLFDDKGTKNGEETSETMSVIGIYDPKVVFDDLNTIKKVFPNAKVKSYDSLANLKTAINDDSLEAGFALKALDSYQYIIKDSVLTDTNVMVFDKLMNSNYEQKTLHNLGIGEEDITKIMQGSIKSDQLIMGKDGVSNYWYAYVMVFIIYFIVIFYGNSTATAIASEKGNRSMEILITSTSPTALIFGKVLATSFAAIVQVALILATAVFAYHFNSASWNGMLDFFFNIPSYVFIAFAIFGTLTYIFYSFIYGALGAMASKVEDVSSTTGPITTLFMLAFFGALYSMIQPDTIMAIIINYLPFTSGMSMIARVAMGSVPFWEVLLSAIILVASTGGVAYIGVILYRRGTLHYGNKFSFVKLLKPHKRNKSTKN